MTRTRKTVVAIVLTVLVLSVVASTQLTVFVVRPFGAAPDGQTLIISRQFNTTLIDSADGICGRLHGGVSILCRIGVLGRIMEEATIYASLPYSETLYSLSTSGTGFSN